LVISVITLEKKVLHDKFQKLLLVNEDMRKDLLNEIEKNSSLELKITELNATFLFYSLFNFMVFVIL
jgi:hypothetical protein